MNVDMLYITNLLIKESIMRFFMFIKLIRMKKEKNNTNIIPRKIAAVLSITTSPKN
jgi:hypothetical protein